MYSTQKYTKREVREVGRLIPPTGRDTVGVIQVDRQVAGRKPTLAKIGESCIVIKYLKRGERPTPLHPQILYPSG